MLMCNPHVALKTFFSIKQWIILITLLNHIINNIFHISIQLICLLTSLQKYFEGVKAQIEIVTIYKKH